VIVIAVGVAVNGLVKKMCCGHNGSVMRGCSTGGILLVHGGCGKQWSLVLVGFRKRIFRAVH